MGIPTRKKKSEFWTKGPIVRLLQTESYFNGYVYFNKSEACVAKKPIKNIKYKKVKKSSRKRRPREEWIPFSIPPILTDRSLFERVQQIMENNKTYAPKNRKHAYLLPGLVFCECGNRRAGDGQNKQGHFYYRCTERIYNFSNLERKCKLPGVNAVILDEMVWRELMNFVKDPKMIKDKVKEVLQQRRNQIANKQEFERLTELVGKIEEEEKRYAKAYGTGNMEFDQFKDLMRDAKKRKSGHQTKSNNLKESSVNEELDNIQVDDICYEAAQILKGIDYSDKNKTVHTLLDKVTIKEGGWVSVCGHIPLNIQKLGDELTSRNSWTSECWEIDPF